MKTRLRVACVQTKAGNHFDHNLKQAIQLTREAIAKKVDLIALPEMFLYRGSLDACSEVAYESIRAILKFQHIAKVSQTAILLGSILEPSAKKGKYYNTSLFISKLGAVLVRYRKIHLFDVRTPGKTVMRESDRILPGKRIVSVKEDSVRFGLSICFDLRFPNQYQALAKNGAQVIFVPSNFLRETGAAHWHSLIRARAIENQAFIVAPAQAGMNPDSGLSSFGHSLIVGPWGEILAQASGARAEVVVANLDLISQARLRTSFPVLRNIS